MPAKAKSKPQKPASSTERKLSNAELLKLAQKHKPPQAWYDEGTDPFKPKPKR